MPDKFKITDPPKPSPFLALVFCGLFHKWFEWKTDFFEPRNVYEQCERCGTRRVRWDNKPYRRSIWSGRKKS